MSRENRDAGISCEERFAKRLGTTPHRGSGNKWYCRLDTGNGQPILWSLKFTTANSFRVTRADLEEAVAATDAPGGSGTIPALGVGIADEVDLVVMRADDLLALLSEDVTYVTPSKSEQKRAAARIPTLLRDHVDG